MLWLPLLLATGCGEGEGAAHELPTEPAAPAEQVAPPAAVEQAACGQDPEKMEPQVFLDVGHGSAIDAIARSEDRVVSHAAERWVLWDATTRKQITAGRFIRSFSSVGGSSGRRFVFVDLAGDLMMTPGERLRFDLRSARDGKLLVSVPIDDRAVKLSGLARDGSYAYLASDRQLRLYDRAGKILNELSGSYEEGPYVSAEPGALHVGGQASQTITTLNTDGSRSQTPEHAGVFHGWFLDGKHFVTLERETIDVYRVDGTLVRKLPRSPDPSGRSEAGGDGQLAWVANRRTNQVRVHRLSDGAEVMQFVGFPALSTRSSQAAFMDAEDRIRFLDLRGAEPASVERDLPSVNIARYSVDADGNWVFGANDGTLLVAKVADERPPSWLGCGGMLSLASAGDSAAIGTQDGRLRVYDLASGTPVLSRTFDELAWRLRFADSGRYLVLQTFLGRPGTHDGSMRVLEASTGRLVHTWPQVVSTTSDPSPDLEAHLMFVTAARADRVARLVCDGPVTKCWVEVTRVDGTPVFRTETYAAHRSAERAFMSLSPNGKRLASLVGGSNGTLDLVVYEETGLVATVKGVTQALFLDDERMLVSRQQRGVSGVLPTVTDAFGNAITALPPLPALQWKVDDDADYFTVAEAVHRVSDGRQQWSVRQHDTMTLRTGLASAITKKRVVHTSSHRALLVPLP